MLDTSGAFVSVMNGDQVAYSVSVADNGLLETDPAPVTGALKGKSVEVESQLSCSLENTAPAAKFKLTKSDKYFIPLSFVRMRTASGSINGVKLNQSDRSGGPLECSPLGGRLAAAVSTAPR